MKTTKIFYVIVFIFFCVVLLLFSVRPSHDPDYVRHIKLGERIWQTKSFVRAEPFVAPTLGTPLYSHNWLFDLFIFAIYSIGGYVGVSLFKTAISFLVFYFVLKSIQNKRIFWLFAFSAIYLFGSRLLPRPDLVSMLFLTIYMFILTRHADNKISTAREGWIGRKTAFLILALHILWVNIHTFYILGLILLFLYLGGMVFERSIREREEYLWLGFLGILTIAALLNPDGYNTFKVLLGQASFARKDGYYLLLDIVELKSPLFFDAPAFRNIYFFMIIVSMLSYLAYIVKQRRLNRFFFIWLFFLFFSSISLRSTAYFCLLAVPITAYNLHAVRDPFIRIFDIYPWMRRQPFLGITQVLVIIFLIFSFKVPLSAVSRDIRARGLPQFLRNSTGYGFNEVSEAALLFIKNNDLPDTILDTYNNGSAISFYCYPKKVFIDSRGLEGQMIKEYLFFLGRENFKQDDILKYKELLNTYNINTVVMPLANPAVARMLHFLPEWKLVYLDEATYIFCRRDRISASLRNQEPYGSAWVQEQAAIINKVTVSEQDAARLNAYARLLLLIDRVDDAQKLFMSASMIAPWNGGYYYNLALCDYFNRRHEDAYKNSYRAYQHDPDNLRYKIILFITAQAYGVVDVQQLMRDELEKSRRLSKDEFLMNVDLFKFSLNIDIESCLLLPSPECNGLRPLIKSGEGRRPTEGALSTSTGSVRGAPEPPHKPK